jgi:hypothetical protein
MVNDPRSHANRSWNYHSAELSIASGDRRIRHQLMISWRRFYGLQLILVILQSSRHFATNALGRVPKYHIVDLVLWCERFT